MAVTPWSVSAGQVPSAVFWNILGTNDAALAAGTAIDDDAILARHIDWASTGVDGGIWWEELARTTLSSTADSISATSIPARKYLRVAINLLNSGSIDGSIRFNGDTSSSYNRRYSENGGADLTNTGATSVGIVGAASGMSLVVIDIINISAQEKVFYWRTTGQTGTGAGNLNNRREGSGKWANTSSQITTITIANGSTGDYASGTELVVLGHN